MQACQLPGTGAIALPGGVLSAPIYYEADGAVPGGYKLVVAQDAARYRAAFATSAHQNPTTATTSAVTPTLANFTVSMAAGGASSRLFTCIVSHEGYVGFPISPGRPGMPMTPV